MQLTESRRYVSEPKRVTASTFDAANVVFAVVGLGFWICLYLLGW